MRFVLGFLLHRWPGGLECSKQNLGRHGGLTEYAFPYYKDVKPEMIEPPDEPRGAKDAAGSHEERDAKWRFSVCI